MNIEELVEAYYKNKDQKDGYVFGKELTEAIHSQHAAGEIDVLKLFVELKKDNPHFFTSFYILEELVKIIDLNIYLVFDCYLHLENESGNDGASGEPKRIFINYLSTQKESFDTLFENVLKEDKYNQYLDWFLLAGYRINKQLYIEKSIELLETDNEHLLRLVIFSLSLCETISQEYIFIILKKIGKILQEESTELYLVILRFLVSVSNKDSCCEAEILLLSERILLHIDDDLIHNCACFLLFDKNISKELELKLIEVIVQVNPNNKGTLQQIDYWLMRLVSKKEIIKILDFVATFNHKNNIILDLSIFDHFSKSFFSTQETLEKLITAIFLSQNFRLIGSFYRIWNVMLHDKDNISVDINQLQSTVIHNPSLYLAKKAYSWLFIYPESMVSYIFSLLLHAKKKEQEGMKEILRYTALNYPTLFNEYFESHIKNNKKNKWIYDEKVVIDQYFEDLNKLPKLLELHTSKENRVYRNMIWQDQVAIGFKSANKDNFLSLISRQTILYGRGSISKVDNFPRQESVLHTMGRNTFLPMMHSLDPHGHGLILKEYKKDNCKEDL